MYNCGSVVIPVDNAVPFGASPRGNCTLDPETLQFFSLRVSSRIKFQVRTSITRPPAQIVVMAPTAKERDRPGQTECLARSLTWKQSSLQRTDQLHHLESASPLDERL